MKVRKVIRLGIIGIILLLEKTVIASNEIVIESITCPAIITIGIKEATGNYKPGDTVSLSFEEYLKGVVYGEMFSGWSTHTLKAQAIAARTLALGKHPKQQHRNDNYDICNTTCCQVWKAPPKDGYPDKVKIAVDTTKGMVIKYNGKMIEYAPFFSHAGDNQPVHYTRNSEDWTRFYHPYLRKTITPEEDQSGDGGHSCGMSQYGAKSLAEPPYNLTYTDILKHYYGPVPPYVKKIIVRQNGIPKYEAEWIDDNNDDYLNPTRRLATTTDTPLDIDFNAQIEIHFSERILTGVPPKVKVKIGGEEASSIQYQPGDKPPAKVIKEITSQQLKRLGAGKHKISIEAKHQFAQEWQLDSNPQTFCYQNHNADNLKYYEEGIDENYEIVIDTFTPVSNIDAVLVIDRSGSMDGEKIESAKNSAKLFVDFMEQGDKIGVVSFSDDVSVDFPLSSIIAETTIFSDNMESGAGNWTAQGSWALINFSV